MCPTVRKIIATNSWAKTMEMERSSCEEHATKAPGRDPPKCLVTSEASVRVEKTYVLSVYGAEQHPWAKVTVT